MSDSHRGNSRPRGGRGNNNNNNPDSNDRRSHQNQSSSNRGRQGGNQHDRRSAQHAASAEASSSAKDSTDNNKERPKRDNILDLKKYLDTKMRIKFSGGREVVGTLKGFDLLMNLVLDEVEEVMRDEEGNEGKRQLGLIVARGPLVTLISPFNGSEEIANPFVQGDGEEGEEPVMDDA